ncbi:hypothetical protein ABT084_37405 [Streptomyces sp. NPDC002138]|uniref:hypothetical protein n=1 Tax=Streptomyces sp. NPDC002138 TaxID=3154410 RepID=UPI00331EB5F2
METETPRTPDGAKLCGWCGGTIRQSGVGRSRDYCKRLCRDQAYKKRRDQRLVDEALAAASAVSPSVETGPRVSTDGETRSPQVTPRIPAPVVEEDYLLAPPDPAPVLPDAWRAPVPAPAPRRTLGAGPGRRRSTMTASPLPTGSRAEPVPLPFDIEDDEGI